MSNVPTQQKLLELLVVSQLEAVQKQEETLKSLPRSSEYLEKVKSLKSEIAAFQSRAERLSRMIQPEQVDGQIAA